MSDGLPEMVRRVAAVEATERHFAGRVFELGKIDCAKLCAFHLRRFGWKLPKVAAYHSDVGAARSLKALGAETLADVLDGIGLQRISPASALVGDLVSMPGNGPSGAICLAIGNGRLRGFHELHHGLVNMQPEIILAAWSVLP
jgi:hypothetical protein